MTQHLENKKLNRFQAKSAGSIVSDETNQQDIAAMIAAGTLPKGLNKYTQQLFEDENSRGLIWYDTTENLWHLKRTSKEDTTDILRVTSASWEGLQDGLRLELAMLERAVAEALDDEFWANPVFTDSEYDQARKWLSSGYPWHGQEYYEIACTAAWEVLKAELQRRKLPITALNLELSYCAVRDRDLNNLENFFQQKAQRDREAAEQANKPVVRKVDLIGNPSGNLPGGISQSRKDEDAANRNLPLPELRRRALFSGKKVTTVPSTGTGRKL